MLQAALSAFVLVFLAELGDKTQLAVMALSGRSKAPWGVFIGASSALVLSTLIAVLLGCNLPKLIPESATRVLHYIAGGLFVVVGAWTIWKA